MGQHRVHGATGLILLGLGHHGDTWGSVGPVTWHSQVSIPNYGSSTEQGQKGEHGSVCVGALADGQMDNESGGNEREEYTGSRQTPSRPG